MWGSQEGSGWGVYGSSNSGIGVYGYSASGNAGYFSANSTTSTATVRLHERADDYARLEFTNTNTDRRWHIAGYIGSTQAEDRLNFWNSAGGDIVSVTGDGKVGIGTSSPADTLHVVGDEEKNRLGSLLWPRRPRRNCRKYKHICVFRLSLFHSLSSSIGPKGQRG
ncbi:MAG: hypothetical protein Q9O62_03520 [Ardenticatenia bacterium]|nr:hypothetical protein [Ardenticatenia bacterium]